MFSGNWVFTLRWVIPTVALCRVGHRIHSIPIGARAGRTAYLDRAILWKPMSLSGQIYQSDFGAIWTFILTRHIRSQWEFYEEHVAVCTGKLRNYNIRARCDRFPAVRIVWQLYCTESRMWALQCIDVKAGSRSQSDDILHVGVAKVTGQTAAQVKASCALSCNRLRGSPLVAHGRKFSPTSFPTLLLEAT